MSNFYKLPKRLVLKFKKYLNESTTNDSIFKENFTKFMDGKTKDYMENNIFRPEGPQGKFEWLSTIDINQVLKQYEEKYADFLFLGAVPIDFDDLSPLNVSFLRKKSLIYRFFL